MILDRHGIRLRAFLFPFDVAFDAALKRLPVAFAAYGCLCTQPLPNVPIWPHIRIQVLSVKLPDSVVVPSPSMSMVIEIFGWAGKLLVLGGIT